MINEKQIPIQIFDTTLRDWDQWPWWGFNEKEKMLIAQILKNLWVDTIEAWFSASKADRSIPMIIEEIWKSSGSPTIASLARANKGDIDACYEDLRGAKKPRIHTFIATSNEQILAKFNGVVWSEDLSKIKNWVLGQISESVEHAASSWFEVEWSAEDAMWSDKDFLLECVKCAIESWAKIINIPDTLWAVTTWEIEDVFRQLVNWTDYLKKDYNFIFSTHNHNDLWNAAINSIHAVRWWARQVESTILWLWERAWNAPIHEIVAQIDDWSKKIISWNELILPKINRGEIWKASKVISMLSWRKIPDNTPIIGSHSAKDGSWIHNDWNLKSKTKPIYTPIEIEKYWTVKAKDEFYSRWWWAEIVEFLSKYWVILDKKDEVISKVVNRSARDAEKCKVVHWANIYANYLEEKWDFSISNWDIDFIWNSVKIKFNLSWNKIEIYWEWNWEWEFENWIINWVVIWINNFLWGKLFSVKDFWVWNKPSVEKVKSEFWMLEGWEVAEKWSEEVWVVNFNVSLKWWEWFNVKSAWNNVEKEYVKALIKWALPLIIEKVNSNK